MKRSVVQAIVKMLASSLLLTVVVGVIIGIAGYINRWSSTVAYSNAFFLAGSLFIIARTSSRLAAGQEWRDFQLLYAEAFREMSSGERAIFIVNASSPLRLALLGLLTGIWLIALSAIAAYLL